MKCIEHESVRYVLAGGFNTAITYAAYVVLLKYVGYGVSYTATYVAGICLSYFLSARFVFRRPLRWQRALQFPLVYVLQYLLGVSLTTALVEIANLRPELAAALAIPITLLPTFWLSRWIIKRDTPARAALPALPGPAVGRSP